MYKKRFVRKKFIFLSIIFSMSIIGAGYATWNEDTKINLSLTTGYLDPVLFLENDEIAFGDERLKLELSDDGRTLDIRGEVFPSFNEDIFIKIIDEGSIPSVLNGLYEENDDIAVLKGLSNSKQRSSLNISSDYIESFEINISPESDNDKIELSNIDSSSSDEISKLEHAIEQLKEDIRLYNKEENYRFEYIISFKQGI